MVGVLKRAGLTVAGIGMIALGVCGTAVPAVAAADVVYVWGQATNPDEDATRRMVATFPITDPSVADPIPATWAVGGSPWDLVSPFTSASEFLEVDGATGYVIANRVDPEAGTSGLSVVAWDSTTGTITGAQLITVADGILNECRSADVLPDGSLLSVCFISDDTGDTYWLGTVSPATGVFTPLLDTTLYGSAQAVATDPTTDLTYLFYPGTDHPVVTVNLGTGATTVAATFAIDENPTGADFTPDGQLWISTATGTRTVTPGTTTPDTWALSALVPLASSAGGAADPRWGLALDTNYTAPVEPQPPIDLPADSPATGPVVHTGGSISQSSNTGWIAAAALGGALFVGGGTAWGLRARQQRVARLTTRSEI